MLLPRTTLRWLIWSSSTFQRSSPQHMADRHLSHSFPNNHVVFTAGHILFKLPPQETQHFVVTVSTMQLDSIRKPFLALWFNLLSHLSVWISANNIHAKTLNVSWVPLHRSDITWYKPVQQTLCQCHCKSVYVRFVWSSCYSFVRT